MIRNFLILVLIIWPGLSVAQERLSAAEIVALIKGHTAIGIWNGTAYRQYFDIDNTTVYAVQGQRSTAGRWRVNQERDSYESWWPRSGWEEWFVDREGEALVWVNALGDRSPFYMVEGRQLVWPD